MLSLHLPSRAVLMHVFIRTFKLKIYFLEFSGLFYYSVIKVPSLSLKDFRFFIKAFFVAALCVSDLFSLSHSFELVNNFFIFIFRHAFARQRDISYHLYSLLSILFFKFLYCVQSRPITKSGSLMLQRRKRDLNPRAA